MQIISIIKDSFQEYENELSLVLFSQGCNYSCIECHNRLTIEKSKGKFKKIGCAKSVINNNLNLLHTAVVFLGGQPTIHEQLYDLCKYVKKTKQRKVKIYTNGSNYKIIQKIYNDRLLDAISIDVKCIRDCNKIIGDNIVSDEQYIQNIKKHIELFRDKKIPVDLRTTLWDCNKDQIEQIQSFINSLQLSDNFKFIKQRKIDI